MKKKKIFLAFILILGFIVLFFILKTKNQELTGIILGVILCAPLTYLALSIRFLKPNEKGSIIVLERTWKEANSGINFVPFIIGRLVKFPTGVQNANLSPEDVMIAATPGFEEESQPINVDLSQPLFFKDVGKIYFKLGCDNAEATLNTLFGPEIEVGKNENGIEKVRRGGIISDRIAALTREYVASDAIKTLDDAYKMSFNLAKNIHKMIEKEYKEDEFGIQWRPTIIHDVKGREEIETARTEKAKTAILRNQASIEKQKTIIDAKAEAEATRQKGMGSADADLARMQAKLKMIKEIGSLDSLKNATQLIAIMLFGTEIASSLKDMGELKLFLAPNLKEILGSFGNQNISADNLINILAGMSDDQKNKIKNEITKLL